MQTSGHDRNAVVVVRVSSPGQVDKYGLEAQQDDAFGRAEALEVNVLKVIRFQESATDSYNRPKFEALLEDLARGSKAGEYQVVIFGRPDRLGRDGEAAFMHYLYILERAGLEIRFGRDDVDPNDTFRGVKLTLYAFKAKEDAKTILANTMGGRNRRAKNGKLPTGQVCWVFDYASKRQVGEASTGKPTLNEERAVWVRRWVIWLLEERVSLREVSRRMEAAGLLSPKGSRRWSPSTITRILKNRALLGEFWRKETGENILVIQDTALAILSPEEFQAIQDLLLMNQQLSRRNTKSDYTPLHLLVRCRCGKKAGAYFRRRPYFRCNCSRRNHWDASELWRKVKATLTVMLSNSGALSDIIEKRVGSVELREQQAAKVARLENEVADLEEAQERAVRMGIWLKNYPAEKVQKEVNRAQEKLNEKRAELEATRSVLEGLDRAEAEAQRIQALGSSFQQRLETADDDAWRNFLLDLGVSLILQQDGRHLLCASVTLPPPLGVQPFISSHDWAERNALLLS